MYTAKNIEKPINQKDLPFRVQDILDEVFSLYAAPNSATQKPVFDKRYRPEAIFEDPMFRVGTPEDRIAQFASLPTIFPKIEIKRAPNGANAKVYNVTPEAAQRDGIPQAATHKQLVRIEAPNMQIYYLPTPFSTVASYISLVPTKIEIDGVTRLTVEKDTGKVVKHQDVWSLTGENLPGILPIVGGPYSWVYAFIKPVLGKTASLGLRGADKVGLLK